MYSDRRCRCNGRPSTSDVCDAQQQQWLACPFFDVVPRWFTRCSYATTTLYCTLYSTIFGNVTMVICKAWWYTIKVPDIRRGCWPVAIRIRPFLLSVWYATHLPVAFVLSSLDFVPADPQSAFSSRIRRAVLTKRVIRRVLSLKETDRFVFFLHNTASLVVASVPVPVCSLLPLIMLN